MTKLNTLRSAATAALAVAAFSLPTLAQASDYHRSYNPSADCKAQEDEAQIVGAVLGAVIGGVIGSEVSGNGARTEGSAIGAVLGGLAGAGIADESVDCDKKRRRAYSTTGYNNGAYTNSDRYSGQVYGSSHNGTYGRPVVRTQRVSTRRTTGIHNGSRTGNHNGYRNVSHRIDPNRHDTRWLSPSDQRRLAKVTDQLADVRFRLVDLREKDARLTRRVRRTNSQRASERLYSVRKEINRLREKSVRLRKRERRILNNWS